MEYINELFKYLGKTVIRDSANQLFDFETFTETMADKISEYYGNGKKIIAIGNGGSAAIASHLTIDLLNHVGVSATCISDNAVMTCFANDYGYDEVYAKPMERIASEGDMVVAISSSGTSKNILNAVKVAKAKGCYVFTLSGFEGGNPLFGMGDANLHVPVEHYGHVELAHQIVLHMLCDLVANKSRN